MLSKKIAIDFNLLREDMKAYSAILKKKFAINYNGKNDKDIIKNSILMLDSIISELTQIHHHYESIEGTLYRHQKYYAKSSAIKRISEKKKHTKKDCDTVIEPNENLINNKNILSGGAWESNRRKH